MITIMTNKGNIQRPNLPICSLDILNLERSINGTIIIRATNNMAKIINTVTCHLPLCRACLYHLCVFPFYANPIAYFITLFFMGPALFANFRPRLRNSSNGVFLLLNNEYNKSIALIIIKLSRRRLSSYFFNQSQ